MNLFCCFFHAKKKNERNPTHIVAHLQTLTNQHSSQRLAKELQFCVLKSNYSINNSKNRHIFIIKNEY